LNIYSQICKPTVKTPPLPITTYYVSLSYSQKLNPQNYIKKYEKITQIPIIPAVNGYQNFGILFGFEFEKKPFLFSFGIMPVLRQK